jgi:hypothetical protein
MRGKRAIAAGVTALFALALAAYALAAREAGTVASYTGCLKNGKIESVALGDAPLAPCGTGQTQVRLSGGDITSVGAGAGLTGGGDSGDVTLAVDPAAVQSRVTGSCLTNRLGPIDASISAIHQDGSVTCNTDDSGAGSDVFAGFYDGPVALPVVPNPNDLQAIAELALPAGKYAIIATINVVNDDLNNANSIDCKLSAGADFDLTGVDLSHAPSVGEELVNDFGRLTLQVVHEFAEPGDVSVRCGSFFAGRWSFLKITATRVATLSNGPLELVSP